MWTIQPQRHAHFQPQQWWIWSFSVIPRPSWCTGGITHHPLIVFSIDLGRGRDQRDWGGKLGKVEPTINYKHTCQVRVEYSIIWCALSLFLISTLWTDGVDIIFLREKKKQQYFRNINKLALGHIMRQAQVKNFTFFQNLFNNPCCNSISPLKIITFFLPIDV